MLEQLQDDAHGELPVYGADDGSVILPLSNRPARDFRPVLQAARAVLRDDRAYTSGPWDEEALWPPPLYCGAGLCAPLL